MSNALNNIFQTIAKLVSIVLYPMLIPTYSIAFLLIALKHYNLPLTTSGAVFFIVMTLIITCFIPLSVIFYLVKKGAIDDIYINSSKQRLWPYIYSTCACLFWVYFLHKSSMPLVVVLMAIAAAIALVLVTFINRWWKISAHLTSFGALVGAVAGWQLNIGQYNFTLLGSLLAASLILMYARIYLKAHTPLQTVIGFLLGLIITFSYSLLV